MTKVFFLNQHNNVGMSVDWSVYNKIVQLLWNKWLPFLLLKAEQYTLVTYMLLAFLCFFLTPCQTPNMNFYKFTIFFYKTL